MVLYAWAGSQGPRKSMWVREGDLVIATPWEIQDSKADVIWRYTRPQVDWLAQRFPEINLNSLMRISRGHPLMCIFLFMDKEK